MTNSASSWPSTGGRSYVGQDNNHFLKGCDTTTDPKANGKI